MPAYLVVRAVVAEADRRDFDGWYRNEHLPDALRAFNARAPGAPGAAPIRPCITHSTSSPMQPRPKPSACRRRSVR